MDPPFIFGYDIKLERHLFFNRIKPNAAAQNRLNQKIKSTFLWINDV